MQEAMTDPVPTSPDNLNKEAVNAHWTLNEVGACLFLRGKAFEEVGDPAEALQTYQQLVETMSYAQCWDVEKGSFWKPAEEAQKRIKVLEAQGVVKKRGIEKPH
jgi:hypothetical protein